MKIKSLTCTNFRQFYGVNKIEFSCDSQKNVTVIHGENGSGKTSILNAFKWCFYKKVDFDTQLDSIPNYQAFSENDEIQVTVEVEFEHDNKMFIVSREQYFKTQDSGLVAQPIGNGQFKISSKSYNGILKEEGAPISFMSQVLPESMHQYFFFNGERIDKLAKSSGTEIQEAIKNLMGVTIVERAQHHLAKNVSRIISKEINKDVDDETLDNLESQIEDLEEIISDSNEKLDEAKSNKNTYKNSLEEVKSKLITIGESLNYVSEKEEIIEIIEMLQEKVSRNLLSRSDQISSEGFLVFGHDIFSGAYKVLESNRQKGMLPFKYRKQFIEDLLSSSNCICCRPLLEGSEERHNVSKLLDESADSSLEEMFASALGRSSLYGEDIEKFKQVFFDYLTVSSQTFEDINLRNERLSELKTILKNFPQNDVAALQNKEDELILSLSSEDEKIGGLKESIRKATEDLEKAKKEQGDIEKLIAKNSKVLNYRKAAKNLEIVLTELFDSIKNFVRLELSEKFSKTYSEVSRKERWSEIDENYQLQIYKKLNSENVLHTERSTGENQIMSLCFIGSIVNLAKEKHLEEANQGYYEGGLFPIVMDSPFGALDDDYREKIANLIPRLAEQVIVLVSSSQWNGKVAQELAPRVGEEWRITTTGLFNDLNKEFESSTVKRID
jgi:DNA sulfur modification protein DndD